MLSHSGGFLTLQVKHNMNRFPEDSMFQLTKDEYESLMLKNSTLSHGGRRKVSLYVSSNPAVATLNSKGKINAVGERTCDIWGYA